MSESQEVVPQERQVALSQLGEAHARLRILDASLVSGMREQLERHGQLTPLVVCAAPEAPQELEVVDGFKRLRGARALGWPSVRVRVVTLERAEAKAAVSLLNAGRGLSGLEEAWVVRALYREERRTQPQIGQLLGRNKSWVSRRLLLAESLHETLQMDVRLGLLAARTAEALGRLPHGNQEQAAQAVMRQGLTQHQTEQWVKELLGLQGPEREAALEQTLEGLREADLVVPRKGCPRRKERLPAQALMEDLFTLMRVAGRLQARLHAQPLSALGAPAAQQVCQGMADLLPVLLALRETLLRKREEPHAGVDHANRT